MIHTHVGWFFLEWLIISEYRVKVRWVMLQECNNDTFAMAVIMTCPNMLNTFIPWLHSLNHYFLLGQERSVSTDVFMLRNNIFLFTYLTFVSESEHVCSVSVLLHIFPPIGKVLAFLGIEELQIPLPVTHLKKSPHILTQVILTRPSPPHTLSCQIQLSLFVLEGVAIYSLSIHVWTYT